jgi:hypothetical protein
MTLTQQRFEVLSAVRACLYAQRVDPLQADALDARLTLAQMSWASPDADYAAWYRSASFHQLVLFREEWEAWREAQQASSVPICTLCLQPSDVSGCVLCSVCLARLEVTR